MIWEFGVIGKALIFFYGLVLIVSNFLKNVIGGATCSIEMVSHILLIFLTIL